MLFVESRLNENKELVTVEEAVAAFITAVPGAVLLKTEVAVYGPLTVVEVQYDAPGEEEGESFFNDIILYNQLKI